jgi:predicted deacylase
MTEPVVPPSLAATSIHGLRPGPRLLVLGAVHGNETCGTVAQRRVLADLEAGRLVVAAGQVTFVPVANPLAFALGRRAGDRNLNRDLSPKAAPQDHEDRLANVLCPLLAAHDVLLDLHSFQAPGRPFVMVGPPDNDGPIEPFAQAAQERALAMRLGVERAVDGWLSTYARGVRDRVRRRGAVAGTGTGTGTGTGADDATAAARDRRYGVGTTEYMRQQGGWALTLECGQHLDPQAPDVAEQAIRRTLAWLGLVEGEPAPSPQAMESLHLELVVDRLHADDRLARTWQPFDPVAAGELVGTRADGTLVTAPFDARIVFPNPQAAPDEEWFYLARPTARFATLDERIAAGAPSTG